MSKGHEGQWHYEIVKAIDGSVKYQVADHDGDAIGLYLFEESAQAAVREHNAKLVKNPDWLY